MTISDNQEWNDRMRFKPDPEIETELAPFKALLSLGLITPESYVIRYHEAGQRKYSNNRASTQI